MARETYRQRNARHRTCPNCQRGGAIKVDLDIVRRERVHSCRWCGFVRTRGLVTDGASREWVIEYDGDPAQKREVQS